MENNIETNTIQMEIQKKSENNQPDTHTDMNLSFTVSILKVLLNVARGHKNKLRLSSNLSLFFL